MVLLQWRDMKLSISESMIYSFEKLSLGFGTKVSQRREQGQEYATKEYTKTQSLSIEVPMSLGLGVDVEAELTKWRQRSQDGGAGKILLAGKDYIGYALMLMECNVSDMEILPNGKLRSAKLRLKFERQEEPPRPASADSSGGGGGGGGGKPKKTPPKNTYTYANGRVGIDTAVPYMYTTAPPVIKATEAWKAAPKSTPKPAVSKGKSFGK